MRKITKVLFGLLSAGVFYGLTASAQTWEEAIFSALENNPRIDRAQAELQAVREQLPQARAQFRPRVSFQSSVSATNRDARLTDGQDFGDSAQPYSSSIRLTQPLYTGGLKTISIRRARLAERAERFRFQDEEVQLALDVTSAFVDIVVAQERLIVQSEVNRLIHEQTQVAEERFRLDVGTITDIAQVKARYAASTASLTTAQTDLIRARVAFETLTGIAPTELQSPLDRSLDVNTLGEAIVLAKEHSPALKALRAQYDAGRMDVVAVSRRKSPQVSLSLEATSARDSSPAIERDDDVRATLSVSIPLMDGGANRSQRREALANRNSLAFALREQEMQLELFVSDLWLRLEANEAELVAQSERLASSELALEGVIKGLGAGIWTTTDVLDATEQVALARLAFVEIKGEAASARLGLKILLGDLNNKK